MRRHRLGTAVLTVSLAVSAITAGAVFATPAFAQPRGHCYGASCNNRDPQSTGCSVDTADNQTWTSPPVNVNGEPVELYLRYSPLCNANWARIDIYDPAFPLHSLWVQNADGNISYLSTQAGSTLWSGMVDGSVPARACVEFWDLTGTSLQDACTGWY